jgi:hypothetical protein
MARAMLFLHLAVTWLQAPTHASTQLNSLKAHDMDGVLPTEHLSAQHTFAQFLQLVLQLLLCVAAGQVAEVQLVLGLRLIQAHLQVKHGRHVTEQHFVLATGTHARHMLASHDSASADGHGLLLTSTAQLRDLLPTARLTHAVRRLKYRVWAKAVLAGPVMPDPLTSQRTCRKEDTKTSHQKPVQLWPLR